MELILDDALKKGIAAHEAGQYSKARKFYRAVLNFNSKHAEANHNLGILEVQNGTK